MSQGSRSNPGQPRSGGGPSRGSGSADQPGRAKQGQAKQGQAKQGQAKQGQAKQGQAKQGQAKQGQAKQGQGKQGQAKKGQGKGQQPRGRSGGAQGGKRSARRDEPDDPVAKLTGPLQKVLARLPETQRKVLELRMGLVDGHPHDLGDTARTLGLSLSEARDIEKRAFEHIREAIPLQQLQRFLQQ
jgi:hypothetical protein